MYVDHTHGQTITVVEKDTGVPLELVTVQTTSGDWNNITNQEGEFILPTLPMATTLIFRRIGFSSVRYSITELIAQDYIVLLEASEYDLDQVVISAARRVQEKRHVSARIQTIRSDAIALQNPQTTADLLGVGGEVFIQKSQQGGGSPMIRGFATNRLVYVVDGVRMNTAIFRSGNIQNIINIDPFSLERAEVLFGPGSVIYGSDAIGGVMSFQTLQPQLSSNSKTQISGKAIARYASSNQEMTGHFSFGVGWEKWSLVTSLSSWRFDHLRQGQNGPRDYLKPTYVQHISGRDEIIRQDDLLLQIPSAYNQMNMMHKLRFMPNDQWDFTYSFHYSETSPYGRYDRHNRVFNGLPRYGVWNYGPQKWMMNNLLVTNNHRWVGYDHMKIRIANQAFQESRIDRNFNDPQLRNRLEEVSAWSFNLDMDKQLGNNYTLFYGLEYVDNRVHSTGETENILTGERRPSSSRYPDAFWCSWAAYMSGEYKLNRRLTLQGGMRLNRFALDMSFLGNQDFYPLPFEEASNDQNAITASMGTVWRPVESWTIRANVGSAFRAPNVDDMGKIFDSEPGRIVVPNLDVEPEKAYSIDVGIAHDWSDQVRWEITGFYTLLNKALVRRPFRFNGQDSLLYNGEMSEVQAIQNAAFAQVYGVQFRFDMNIAAGWLWSTHINLQTGKEETDAGSISPSRHAAPIFGLSRISYQKEAFHFQGYIHFQGQRNFEELAFSERGKTDIYALDDQGQPFAPAWYTLNLKAQYKIDERFTISGGVENMTDQRYRPYSAGLSGSGRNFILSLQLKW